MAHVKSGPGALCLSIPRAVALGAVAMLLLVLSARDLWCYTHYTTWRPGKWLDTREAEYEWFDARYTVPASLWRWLTYVSNGRPAVVLVNPNDAKIGVVTMMSPQLAVIVGAAGLLVLAVAVAVLSCRANKLHTS